MDLCTCSHLLAIKQGLDPRSLSYAVSGSWSRGSVRRAVFLKLDSYVYKIANSPYLSASTNLKCKWIKELCIKPDTSNLKAEKMKNNR